MRSSQRELADRLYRWIESKYRAHARVKDVRRYLRKMNGGCREHDSVYRSVVIPYWKRFGVRPSKLWHRLYGQQGVPYDVRYIPDDLWFNNILPYFSNMEFRRPYEDKCMHHLFFPEVERPVTVVKMIAGLFYDENLNILSKDKALELIIRESHELIVKPSVDSGGGRLVQFFSPQTTSLDAMVELLERMGKNYIIQRVLSQHDTLAQFNASSINTIRTLSLLFNGEIHILSTALRIGAEKSRVDNFSKGGLMCRIMQNGSLDTYAYNNAREKFENIGASGPLQDIQIPAFIEIIEIIKREHLKLPHFKLIGWDFTVSPEELPILIEYNVCPGGNQMTCGPAFGELTDEVLEDVFIKMSLRGSQN